MPCYNQSKFLEEAVESVLKSQYPEWELIIVNDGSTDNSSQVGMELALQYPNQITFIDQENKGPAEARNLGIGKALGKYILPLDGDDKISPNYISEAVKILESNPEVKVVYCEAEKFGTESGPWKLKPFSLPALAKDNMIFVSSLYRKSDWERCGGYDARMIWGWEDWEFWINVLKGGGQVIKLPITGFYYRVRSNSRRKSVNNLDKKKTIDLINQKHPDFLQQYLNGPLRFQRSLSYWINTVLKYSGLRFG
jgi:glycosyltransferase involved in cell wall biosynthesis